MYRITNRVSGLVLGDYAGTTRDEALEALARDSGYTTYAKMQEVAPAPDDELLVEEIDAPRGAKYRWIKLGGPLHGHRFFRDYNTQRVAVADNSGGTPEQTDDGVLFLATARPATIGAYEHGGAVRIAIPVCNPEGRDVGSVGGNADEALFVARHFPEVKLKLASDDVDRDSWCLLAAIRAEVVLSKIRAQCVAIGRIDGSFTVDVDVAEVRHASALVREATTPKLRR